MALRDIAEFTGEKYTEVFAVAYFHDKLTNSVFWLESGNWIYSPRMHFVGGPLDGQEEIISSEEYKYYEEQYHQAYGRYIPGGLFRDPKFIPGSKRSTLPLYKSDGSGCGYIDEDGPHWEPLQRPYIT